ncbi:BolA/IbaG family iron-sulfur metabolism protein [Candidatus Tisiphia endosymbiont of Nemotelus uliginosus]|uniref:BolA/IbaG family iron-sulfur metabolism protein n=1 Tax=Candidatus Tisiphia endosymbiont of Nemotelus uliginosus TaxID=3077926 RepID=UPI0035C8F603
MAISIQRLEEIIRDTFPNAKINITDYVGDQDHYSLVIEDEAFIGVSLINQHKMVKKSLAQIMDNDQLHAITIQTIVPSPN